jgi:uncharacterized protein (TIGR00725 family)
VWPLATNVAVFGSSEPPEGDPLYEEARRVGYLLARAGFAVVSGGYAGVMEGASRGAREAGGAAIGVTSKDLGRGSGNKYLSVEHSEADLFERTRRLIAISSAYIILRGKAGTLAEATFLWALHRAGLLNGKPIVLLGPFWRGFVEDLIDRKLLEPGQAAATMHAATPEEAVELVRRQGIPT